MTHHHHHPPQPHDGIDAPPREEDPALSSLSGALKASFRLLSLIMIVFVLLFLKTGLVTVEQQEKGILKVFGRVTGVAEPGLVYNWPFPIGQVEMVSTQERRLTVDDFWMNETAADKLKSLQQRRRSDEGLRPGWDGYLLTGDRNLIHVRFTCTYRVQDVLALAKNAPARDPDEILRMVLCESAIQAAASETADAIQADHTAWTADVETRAQRQLDDLLGTGAVRITNVLVPADGKIWPLGAYTAYEQAQQAKSEKQDRINRAIATAKETLIEAAGAAHFPELVGTPWNDPQLEARRTAEGTDGQTPYNLIGQYAQATHDLAVKAGRLQPIDEASARRIAQLSQVELQARADDLLARIDEVLTRNTIGGQASKLIAEAEAEKTRIIQTAARRQKQFTDLRGEYDKAPAVFLEKAWAEALDEVLARPLVTKYYFSPGHFGSVLRIEPDQAYQKQMRSYQRSQAREKPSD